MSNTTTTYYSKIYKAFKAIDVKEHLSIVRFYESYEQDIPHLNFSEHFELLISYIEALFEVGAYDNHLRIVDKAIQLSIVHNIKFYNGRDIYTELLFKKAASCYNLMQYDQAEHILRELVKISPYNETTQRFLKKCLTKKQPAYLRNAKGLAILLFLSTALIIAIQLIIVKSLMPEYNSYFEYASYTAFGGGLIAWLGTITFHRLEIYFWVKQFVKECKLRKA